jgi:hypothetical protein
MEKLTVGDGQSFKTHHEVLVKVFGKTNRRGEPMRLALRGGYEIARNRWAVFFCLAEPWKRGGWYSPRKDNTWLNIPDRGGRAFTQIQLNKTDGSFFEAAPPKKDIAVFMYMRIQGVYRYCFYGIFERHDVNKTTGICVFERTSRTLRCSEWAAL